MLKKLLKDDIGKSVEEYTMKRQGGEDVPTISGGYLPHLDFSGKDIPEIKDWEVGEEYHLLLKVKMTSLSEREEKDEKTAHACFEVEQVCVIDAKEAKEDE